MGTSGRGSVGTSGRGSVGTSVRGVWGPVLGVCGDQW